MIVDYFYVFGGTVGDSLRAASRGICGSLFSGNPDDFEEFRDNSNRALVIAIE